MKRADLIIAGASFAGLACASEAAQRGLSTVVLERNREPGRPCRTTGILVKEAADELRPPSRFLRPIEGVRLYSPSLRFIDLSSPGYTFFATETPDLIRWLASEARRRGAEIRCVSPFIGAVRSAGRWHVAGTSRALR